MSAIRATPFHASAAAANRLNAWASRNGWTLAAHYGDAGAEAVAARTTAAIADISWRSRLTIEGARAEEFLARLLTRDPAKLVPGKAFKALWLTDRGGIRGAGALARHGRESFLLVAAESDLDWIAHAAALFDVRVREVDEGGLAIFGPYARKVVEAAGLDGALDGLNFRKSFWRGLDVMLSRFGEHGGYEIWCAPDDAPLVWNRIVKAGAAFALKPAGLRAMDILDLEGGVPRSGRDYQAARDSFAATPTPFELGLKSLIDEDHAIFNGRAACLAAPRLRTRVGIELDDETPVPNALLLCGGRQVGQTMSSLYSPALGRAIALAIVDATAAELGEELTISGRSARVAALPFLPIPDQIGE
jgi:aminomethyltransferase